MGGPDRLIGEIASSVGMESWRLRRLIERGLVPRPRRIGRFNVFSVDDIPDIRAAAERAGYLHAQTIAEPISA